MKKLVALLMVLFTSFVWAGEIKIGVIAPLSGPIAVYGQATVNGFKLAAEKINEKGGILGNKIKLIIEDNKGDAAEAVNAAKKLINLDKVVAVLGPVISTNSLAVAPIMQESKIPMLTPTGTNVKITEAGDYVSRVCFIDPFQGDVMANFAIDNLKVNSAVIMKDVNSDYSDGLGQAFKKRFEARGGKVISEISYAAGDVDFTSQLTKIKIKKPDVIFVPGYYSEVALIVKQARDLKINSTFLGGDGWDNGKLFEIAGSAINGSYISTHFSPESADPMVQNFLKDYNSRFGEAPSVLAALGYDGADVMFAAMNRAGEINSEKIKDEINKTTKFKGVTGVITLDKNRNAVKSAFVIEAKDGKFVYKTTVEPVVESTAKEVKQAATKEPVKAPKKSNSNNTVIIAIIAVVALFIGVSLVKKK
ncbi:ABC transporter substrate-binding protein [Haliovirga abyssi]|uniref:Ethanolamine utilization protein EutJ n=1 Tax=Haliovirga abyssi TaxID=2996794 RepID=A0AAU9D7B0_9FUSO|nr:ABC transporter substrate-binding protein [Haliovirga abyssi]BDU49461.1 ethanolamine utilization protein EutJ [Haliovirga abyssi]